MAATPTAHDSPSDGPSAVACAVLVVLSVAIVAALCFWSAQNRNVGLFLYGRVSYWIILALIVVWIWQIGRILMERRFNLVAFVRLRWVPLAAALLMTTIAVTAVRPQFRVLSDETNLLAVSQSMVYHKTPYNSTEQKRFFGWMNPLNFVVEKRPLVFPFFVNIVHTVTGYSAKNPFVVNAVALFALLAMVGVLAGKSLGPAAAIAAVVLVGSYPLVVNCGRSAGFDLVTTLFTGLSFVMAYSHMKVPSARRLAVLAATLLVLAQIRYESVVCVGVIGLGLILFGYVRLRYLREHWALYCLSPLLLLPLFVQRLLTSASLENAPGTPAFSIEHFNKFLAIFMRAQTNTEFMLPYAPVISWLAVPILILLGIRVVQRHAGLNPPRRMHLLVIALAAFVLNYAIVFSFHGSDYTHPGAARYFLTMSVLIALLPVFLHGQLPQFATGSRLLIFAGAFALVHLPVSVQGKFTQVQTLVRATEIEWSFLEKYNDPNILIVTERPGQFTVLNYGAVSVDYAKNNAENLLYELRRHLYSQILVFQNITYGKPDYPTSGQLPPSFRLEKLTELQNSATEYVRISRVVR